MTYKHVPPVPQHQTLCHITTSTRKHFRVHASTRPVEHAHPEAPPPSRAHELAERGQPSAPPTSSRASLYHGTKGRHLMPSCHCRITRHPMHPHPHRGTRSSQWHVKPLNREQQHGPCQCPSRQGQQQGQRQPGRQEQQQTHAAP